MIGLLTMSGLLLGCTATRTDVYRAAGSESICGPGAGSLGRVVVLPETAWRANQKDVAQRLEMAQRAIESAFGDLSCGSLDAPGGIRAFTHWSARPEAAVLAEFQKEGVDTVIFLRLEELTPRLLVTLSVPFLWSGASEADLRIRVVTTKPNSVLLDLRVKRSTGGPFHVRPAGWAEAELEAALRDMILGAALE